MIYCFSDFELDDQRFELRSANVKVPVQPKVLDVLLYLVRARERVVAKRELLDAVWADVVVGDASVARVIMEARRAIRDELQQTIVTVRGRGFRFAGPVVERERTTAPPPAPAAADPTFVGRAAATAAVQARLDEAVAGRGSLVLLSGEAGIGKTRTAVEIARRARARDAVVFETRAHESPPMPAFWVWAQLLRAATEGRADAAAREVLQAAEPLLAGEGGDVAPAERFPIFEAIVRFWATLARVRPVALVLEDMHWADEGSLQLLAFLARELRALAALVVVTYRDTVPGDNARARQLGGLLVESSSLVVPLRGLSPDESARLVEVVTGATPSDALVKSLFERSGGNPLYLHQLLKTDWAERALNDAAEELVSSMDLQQGLIESIGGHLDSLSPGARELLATAAVLGREFELGKLALASSSTQQHLLDRLDEAVHARVLVKSKNDYRFAHVLVRDVLYKRLSGVERAERHRAVATRLIEHYGDAAVAHAGELAEHLLRALPAGDATLAVDLAVRAAQQASDLGRHRDAVRRWQQAAQALTFAREQGRRVDVQLGMARSMVLAGLKDAAREAFFDGAILARTFGRAEALAEAALGFAGLDVNASPERRPLLQDARARLTAAGLAGLEGLVARLDAALAEDPDV